VALSAFPVYLRPVYLFSGPFAFPCSEETTPWSNVVGPRTAAVVNNGPRGNPTGTAPAGRRACVPNATRPLAGTPAALDGVTMTSGGNAKIADRRIDRAQVDRARLGRARIGRARVDRARIGRARIGRARIGRAPVVPAQVEQARAAGANAVRAQAGQAWIGSQPHGQRVTVGRPRVGVRADRQVPDATIACERTGPVPIAPVPIAREMVGDGPIVPEMVGDGPIARVLTRLAPTVLVIATATVTATVVRPTRSARTG
jgi:hypothetical protein